MKRSIIVGLAGALACVSLLGGCAAPQETNSQGNASASVEMASPAAAPANTAGTEDEGAAVAQSQLGSAQVIINGSTFDINLADNATAAAFAELLPLEVQMDELNGNEKYVYLDETLPSNPANLGTIEAGDVMLYGDSCVVVFYESHPTSYTYTPIGKIADPSALQATVGTGSINASFSRA